MSWYFDLCCYFCKKLSVSQQENKQDPVISQIMSVLFDSSVNLEMWDCRSPKPQRRSFTTWPGLTDGPIGGRLPDPIPYPHTWCNKGWAELVNCWWAIDYAWLSIARKQHRKWTTFCLQWWVLQSLQNKESAMSLSVVTKYWPVWMPVPVKHRLSTTYNTQCSWYMHSAP